MAHHKHTFIRHNNSICGLKVSSLSSVLSVCIVLHLCAPLVRLVRLKTTPSNVFYHTVVSHLNHSCSVYGCGGRERRLVRSRRPPACSCFPSSQHRTKALRKLAMASISAVAAVRVTMEFHPTSLP